jgi:hypothetical protein
MKLRSLLSFKRRCAKLRSLLANYARVGRGGSNSDEIHTCPELTEGSG